MTTTIIATAFAAIMSCVSPSEGDVPTDEVPKEDIEQQLFCCTSASDSGEGDGCKSIPSLQGAENTCEGLFILNCPNDSVFVWSPGGHVSCPRGD